MPQHETVGLDYCMNIHPNLREHEQFHEDKSSWGGGEIVANNYSSSPVSVYTKGLRFADCTVIVKIQ